MLYIYIYMLYIYICYIYIYMLYIYVTYQLTYQQQGENIGNIKNMRKNRKRNMIDESQCLRFLPVDACAYFLAGETLNKRDEFF